MGRVFSGRRSFLVRGIAHVGGPPQRWRRAVRSVAVLLAAAALGVVLRLERVSILYEWRQSTSAAADLSSSQHHLRVELEEPEQSGMQKRAAECGAALVPQRPIDLHFSASRFACQGSQRATATTIVTSMDSAFVDRLLPFLSALHRHTRSAHRVIVLSTSTNASHLSDACALAHSLLPNLALEFCSVLRPDVEAIFSYRLPNATYGSELPHVSITTMLRLLSPLLLPAHRRVVYLDLDVLVQTDVAALLAGKGCTPRRATSGWSFLHPTGICAKPEYRDNMSRWLTREVRCALNISTDFPEFNAGVMVLDLGILRERRLVHYAVLLSQAFSLNDQVILNLFADGAFAVLAPSLNVYMELALSRGTSLNGDAMLHSAGPKKPWDELDHPWWGSKWAQLELPGILFVWSSLTDPPPQSALDALRAAALHSAGRPVSALCATRLCVAALQLGNISGVRVRLMRLRHFAHAQSPMSPWFARHALHKVVHGRHYVHHFDAAVRLAVLHMFGGLLLNWGSTLQQKVPFERFKGPWCADELGGDQPAVMFAPRHDAALGTIIADFIATYPAYAQGDAWPVDWTFDWLRKCSPRSSRPPVSLSSYVQHGSAIEALSAPAARQSFFGVLWYDGRWAEMAQRGSPRVNLGDEVQSLAAAQWLPHIDARVDRDRLVVASLPDAPVTVLLNAWYGATHMVWPPQGNLQPVLLSMHVEPSVRAMFATNASVAFMSARAPVGARDTDTLAFFQSLNVSAFFSGCLTLTLVAPHTRQPSDGCGALLVDVDDATLEALIPGRIAACAARVSPRWLHDANQTLDGVLRFQQAARLLDQYAGATVLVTTRLHAALPAAAVGVPTILAVTDHMPEGGSASSSLSRFSGLTEFVHFVVVSDGRVTTSNFDIASFDWDAPPPNPSRPALLKLRCGLLDKIRNARPQLADSLDMFDLSPPAERCKRR